VESLVDGVARGADHGREGNCSGELEASMERLPERRTAAFVHGAGRPPLWNCWGGCLPASTVRQPGRRLPALWTRHGPRWRRCVRVYPANV